MILNKIYKEYHFLLWIELNGRTTAGQMDKI